jgi:hypothetical protein
MARLYDADITIRVIFKVSVVGFAIVVSVIIIIVVLVESVTMESSKRKTQSLNSCKLFPLCLWLKYVLLIYRVCLYVACVGV